MLTSPRLGIVQSLIFAIAILVLLLRRPERYTTQVPVAQVKLVKLVRYSFTSPNWTGTKVVPFNVFSIGGGRMAFRVDGHATTTLYPDAKTALYAYTHQGPRRRVTAASIPVFSKPVLPVGHYDTGVPQATIDAIQKFLLDKVTAQNPVYDPTRDGRLWLLANKHKVSASAYQEKIARMRAPTNDREKMLLAYFQKVCDDLINEVGKVMPGTDAARRLARNSANRLVALCPSEVQGISMYLKNGNSIMLVNPDYNIAKTYNIIAHELAHNANNPPEELPDSERSGIASAGHGWLHTRTWKNFVRIGIQRLGWDFVEWSYPNCCKRYNICDMGEFDPAKVYNGEAMRPMKNASFDGYSSTSVEDMFSKK
jgi:hypothetical protein